jgi:hypothetical protein
MHTAIYLYFINIFNLNLNLIVKFAFVNIKPVLNY